MKNKPDGAGPSAPGSTDPDAIADDLPGATLPSPSGDGLADTVITGAPPASGPAPRPEGLRLGPFDVGEPLGRGGMAAVWRGTHRASGTPVAVKIVRGALAGEPRYRAAFAREVRAVARLDHPAIVSVFDHGALDTAVAEASGLPPGAPYLVMERLDPGPLAGSGVGSWPALAAMLETLLDALGHAHARGVVHRDLKPDNILGRGGAPVITDFGLAFRPGRGGTTLSASGTPGYMAPEQIKGEWRRFGPETDLYAVGCIAWEVVCGQPPHGGRSPLAIAMAHVNQPLPDFEARLAVPPRLEGWLRRMLARAPEERFRFAAEALWALRAIIDDRRPSPLPLPADWRVDTRPPRPATLLGVGRALFGHRAWPPAGREAERDRLWRALGEALSGDRPRAVVIEGPSGYGKSHLADWLAERAHRAGRAHLLRAHHQPLGPDGGPGGGLGPMLARALGVDGHDPHHALGRLAALPALRDGPRVRAMQIAALAAPDGQCIDGDRAVRLDAAARRALWPTALDALASDRPLVVVIDDVQWGPATLRAVERVLDEGRRPLLLLLTVRSDAVDRGSPIEARLRALAERSDVERITLGPLDAAAHRRIIRALLPVDEALADALVERAAGSPLFAAELLRHFIGADLLRDGPGGYRLAPEAADALPRGLQAVWQARLVDALGGDAADAWGALETAAALGLSVHGETWRAVCARLGLTWPAGGLERLFDAHLLSARGDDGWSFCHAMLRETLTAAARGSGRWAGLNRICAEVLAERGADPLRVATHLLDGGRPEAALEPLRLASVQALLDGEMELFARLIGRRIAALRRIRAPRADARWRSVRLHRARLDAREGRYGAALRRARRVERAAARAGDATNHARALYAVSNALYYTEGPRVSLGPIADAVPLARSTGDAALLEPILSDYGSTLMFLGRLAEAEQALLEAWRCLDARRQPRRAGTVLYYLANCSAFSEDIAPAIHRCRQARAAFAAAGSRHPEALTWSVEGDLERRRGALDAAAACYRAFEEQVHVVGPAERAYLSLNRALLALAHGRDRRAFAGLEAAAAEDISTQRAVIAAGHLACAAGLGDWPMWDAAGLRLLAVVDDAPLSPDVPWAADLAARRADAAGHAERAAFARRIAADHRARLRGGGEAGISTTPG